MKKFMMVIAVMAVLLSGCGSLHQTEGTKVDRIVDAYVYNYVLDEYVWDGSLTYYLDGHIKYDRTIRATDEGYYCDGEIETVYVRSSQEIIDRVWDEIGKK